MKEYALPIVVSDKLSGGEAQASCKGRIVYAQYMHKGACNKTRICHLQDLCAWLDSLEIGIYALPSVLLKHMHTDGWSIFRRGKIVIITKITA